MTTLESQLEAREARKRILATVGGTVRGVRAARVLPDVETFAADRDAVLARALPILLRAES